MAALLLVVGASPAMAQVPRLFAEGRLGVAIPSGALAEESAAGGATTGAGFGAGFALAVRGGLYVNLGFSQHRFECSEGCSGFGDLTATGFDLALRYAFDAGRVFPYLRAGALPYSVEGAEDEATGVAPVSDHVWGWEAGGGLAVPLSENVHLSPGLRYVALDPDLPSPGGPDGPDTLRLELRGWILDLGLVWAF